MTGEVGLDLVQKVVAALPGDANRMSSATRRQVVQVIHRVLALAVFPARLLKANPLPRGFVPKAKGRRAKSYLYPLEDLQLLSCKHVPLLNRLLYGLLAREGMRVGEALSLTWADLDLERGVLHLDENKTDDPRAWALQPDVAEALRRWRRLNDLPASDTRVLVDAAGTTIDQYEAARDMRAHLRTAGVMRPQLFEENDTRIPIRVHDFRASFVTVNLALGKTEAWITDRTGHQSSQMIYAYKRQARSHAELSLGAFEALHEAIPELRELGSAA